MSADKLHPAVRREALGTVRGLYRASLALKMSSWRYGESVFGIRMDIKVIPSRATLILRSEVLRPGRNISGCIFEGDDTPTTRHFGAVDEAGNIRGIVSVYRNGNAVIENADIYQVRAMATSPVCRGQGVGSLLLSAAESYAKSQGASLIWANARSNAVGFYAKAGYSPISSEFIIDGVGAHYLVIKSLV